MGVVTVCRCKGAACMDVPMDVSRPHLTPIPWRTALVMGDSTHGFVIVPPTQLREPQ